jgi:hypothetical protein
MKSDNGTQFTSAEFKDYCTLINVEHVKITARWPQANGEVERQNRSILKRLKIAQAEKRDWKSALTTYLLAYRSTPHNTTGVSPAELLFSRKIRTKLPDFVQRESKPDVLVRDRDSEQKAKGKLWADDSRGAKTSEIDLGDKVLVRQDRHDKLTTTFNPTPHTVVSKAGNSTIVQAPTGEQYSRNTHHLKKYMTPAQEVSHREDKSQDLSQDICEAPHHNAHSEPPAVPDVSQQPVSGTDTVPSETRRSTRERRAPRRYVEE